MVEEVFTARPSAQVMMSSPFGNTDTARTCTCTLLFHCDCASARALCLPPSHILNMHVCAHCVCVFQPQPTRRHQTIRFQIGFGGFMELTLSTASTVSSSQNSTLLCSLLTALSTVRWMTATGASSITATTGGLRACACDCACVLVPATVPVSVPVPATVHDRVSVRATIGNSIFLRSCHCRFVCLRASECALPFKQVPAHISFERIF